MSTSLLYPVKGRKSRDFYELFQKSAIHDRADDLADVLPLGIRVHKLGNRLATLGRTEVVTGNQRDILIPERRGLQVTHEIASRLKPFGNRLTRRILRVLVIQRDIDKRRTKRMDNAGFLVFQPDIHLALFHDVTGVRDGLGVLAERDEFRSRPDTDITGKDGDIVHAGEVPVGLNQLDRFRHTRPRARSREVARVGSLREAEKEVVLEVQEPHNVAVDGIVDSPVLPRLKIVFHVEVDEAVQQRRGNLVVKPLIFLPVASRHDVTALGELEFPDLAVKNDLIGRRLYRRGSRREFIEEQDSVFGVLEEFRGHPLRFAIDNHRDTTEVNRVHQGKPDVIDRTPGGIADLADDIGLADARSAVDENGVLELEAKHNSLGDFLDTDTDDTICGRCLTSHFCSPFLGGLLHTHAV